MIGVFHRILLFDNPWPGVTLSSQRMAENKRNYS